MVRSNRKKLTATSLLLVICCHLISAVKLNFELKIENVNDYTFEANSKSCSDVRVELSSDQSGLVHSPNYRRNTTDDENSVVNTDEKSLVKCQWTLTAPPDHQIQIDLIDYQLSDAEKTAQATCQSHLTFTSGLISVELNEPVSNEDRSDDADDESSNIKKSIRPDTKTTVMNHTSLTSCQFPFQSFTRLNIRDNKLLIEYNSADGLKFLAAFKTLRKPETTTTTTTTTAKEQPLPVTCDFGNNEMECETQFTVSGQNYSQITCVNKDLICNCLLLYPILDKTNSSTTASTATTTTTNGKSRNDLSAFVVQQQSGHKMDTCDYLIDTYEYYLLSLQQSRRNLCSYYLGMNAKCLAQAVTVEQAAHPDKLVNTKSLNDDMSGVSLVEEADEGDDAGPLASPPWSQKKSSFNSPAALRLLSNNNDDSIGPAELLTKYCTNVFRTNEFGWLASPNLYMPAGSNASLAYPASINCSYHIIMQPYQSVQLRFKYFSLNAAASSVVPNNNNNGTLDSDFDSLSLYDGPTAAAPLLIRLTALHNDFSRYLASRAFTAKSNIMLVVFHSAASSLRKPPSSGEFQQKILSGFNFTYQIKGYCIEDQRSCNMLYETNCYAPAQVCNDVWDCANGADERGCEPCKADQFKCRNHIFCFRADERCDGDHHCTDKSDELNCAAWQCNAANGTFLCANGRCIYEQWQCDGTVDCEDGSDEVNCPSTFSTRRVITTAVLGGTLCCLLLVMALGCACKLYTLHTVSYRSSMRLTQATSSTTQPLMTNSPSSPTSLLPTTNSNTTDTTSRPRHGSRHRNGSRVQSMVRSFLRRSSRNGSLNLNNASSILPTSITQNALQATSSSHQQPPILPVSNSTTGNLLDFSTTELGGMPMAAPASHSVLLNEPLPPPHHLIAPPTYNQTMGLVDEYEQRQLAFLEHVRSILSQQQQQDNGATGMSPPSSSSLTGNTNGQLASLNLMIPTVASSSTTVVHRVTSNSVSGSGSGARRSHSNRHGHRHHRDRHGHGSTAGSGGGGGHRSHHRGDRVVIDRDPASGGSGGATRVSDPAVAQQITAGQIPIPLPGVDASSRTAVGAAPRYHRNHRHSRHAVGGIGSGASNSSSGGGQFDANRRGLQLNLPNDSSSSSLSNANNANQGHSGLRQHQMMPIPLGGGNGSSAITAAAAACTATTSSGSAGGVASTTNAPGQSSANLRDKIARLIKDIVVHNHHDTNIHYEQLPAAAGTPTSGAQLVGHTSAPSTGTTATAAGDVFARDSVSSRVEEAVAGRRTNAASTASRGTTVEDDVPLLLP